MKHPTTERVAANIRAELARQRISQAQIAVTLGITQQSASRRLSGDQPLTVDAVVAFANALGVPVDVLLADLVAA